MPSGPLVGVNDWAKTLDAGLDTYLGAQFGGGRELSGGQWQKLALARALAREADLMVLDEPTAALDPESEALLFRRLLDQKRADARTITVIVSHRLGFCPWADWMLVMDRGAVTQQGRHDELLRQDGPYRAMFETQRAMYGHARANSIR